MLMPQISSPGNMTLTLLRPFLTSTTTGKPYIFGNYALACAIVFCFAMLCYFLVIKGAEDNVVEHATVWPGYVRQRLLYTSIYLFVSFALSFVTAIGAASNSKVLALTDHLSNTVLFCFIAIIAINAIVLKSIDYNSYPITKHLAYATHCVVQGIFLASIYCYFKGAVLNAACWTLGIIGASSVITIYAPIGKFFKMARPLAFGLSIMFIPSIINGILLFSPNTTIGAILASIDVYGGLILFPLYQLHDTQRLIKLAEMELPRNDNDLNRDNQLGQLQQHQIEQQMLDKIEAVPQYDPINTQLLIFFNVLNIFIRMTMILHGDLHYSQSLIDEQE